MKLLIVDDSMTLRMMLQNYTSEWGYEPVLAEDGIEAWDILQTDAAPSLILLDWEMPGMNGPEVCRKVRSVKTDDPPFIILLTSHSETDKIVAGLEAGANDYVTKPFNKAELKARMDVGKRMLSLQSALNKANQKLAYQATHDALTGLLNRRAMIGDLETELERAQKDKASLCVAIGDVDYFKHINDTYGHPAGDAVLKELASRFENALGPCGKVGRYGGEEFLFIINQSQQDIHGLFERIREAVISKPFQFDNVSQKVTISLGVTQCVFPIDSCDSETLLKQADIALYEAKSSGRNRAVFAQRADVTTMDLSEIA